MPCCTTAHSPSARHDEACAGRSGSRRRWRCCRPARSGGWCAPAPRRRGRCGRRCRAVRPACCASACRGRRRRRCRARAARGLSPRLSAPITDVVMPDECQSMPITAAERLEPERIAQPRQELRTPVVLQDAFGDRRAERGHALGQPGGTPPHGAADRRRRSVSPLSTGGERVDEVIHDVLRHASGDVHHRPVLLHFDAVVDLQHLPAGYREC